MTVDEMLAAIEHIREQMGWNTPEYRLRQAAIADVDRIRAAAQKATTMEEIAALQAELDQVEPTFQAALARITR